MALGVGALQLLGAFERLPARQSGLVQEESLIHLGGLRHHIAQCQRTRLAHEVADIRRRLGLHRQGPDLPTGAKACRSKAAASASGRGVGLLGGVGVCAQSKSLQPRTGLGACGQRLGDGRGLGEPVGQRVRLALAQPLGLALQALAELRTAVVGLNKNPAALLRMAVVGCVDHPPLDGVAELLEARQNDGEVAAFAGRRAGQQPVDVLQHQVQQRTPSAQAGLQQAVDAPPQNPFLAGQSLGAAQRLSNRVVLTGETAHQHLGVQSVQV